MEPMGRGTFEPSLKIRLPSIIIPTQEAADEARALAAFLRKTSSPLEEIELVPWA